MLFDYIVYFYFQNKSKNLLQLRKITNKFQITEFVFNIYVTKTAKIYQNCNHLILIRLPSSIVFIKC